MRLSELSKSKKDLIKRAAAALILCALTAAVIAAADAGRFYGNEVNDAMDNIYAVAESAEEE
ncbi:MAG: hypothetical protein J5925_04640 [Clostridia bacterium]|nr:hypothetical protein [Clostridia bacterium]MBR4800040.1 hypothetical protein [Clostridia bacterium]